MQGIHRIVRRAALGFALPAILLAGNASGQEEEPEHADAVQEAPATTAPVKRKHRHAAYSGRLASPDELRDQPVGRPSGHIELYAVNFGETLSVNIFNEDGSYNDEALDELNHIWRCKRTGTEKAIEPKLFVILSTIYDHFHKRIELVSGFRNQRRTSSFHFHGSASDIHIAGVPDPVLHKFVSSLDTGGMGIGIYPRGGFIHVDIRPEASYRWVDNSAPGSRNMGHPKRRPSPST